MKPLDTDPLPMQAPAPPPGLAQALRMAADELQQLTPPPELQARVLAAVQAAAAASPAAAGGRLPRPARSGWWAWSGAVACASVLAASALLMLRMPASTPGDDGVRVGGLGGGFLPLVPPERWPREAAPAWLISTELPSERLAALGLPYDPARAGDSVRAELLLHPSGEVLAVRFLH